MNKNLKIYCGLVIAAIIGTIVYFLFFRYDPSDGHVHEDGTTHGAEKTEAGHDEGEEGHDDHAHEKMVQLNEAQKFKIAGIDTGRFD